jgi:hypothetical protein
MLREYIKDLISDIDTIMITDIVINENKTFTVNVKRKGISESHYNNYYNKIIKAAAIAAISNRLKPYFKDTDYNIIVTLETKSLNILLYKDQCLSYDERENNSETEFRGLMNLI